MISSLLLSQAADRESDLGCARRENDDQCFPDPTTSLLQRQRSLKQVAYQESVPDILDAFGLKSLLHDSKVSRSLHGTKTAGPSLVILTFWVDDDAYTHNHPKLAAFQASRKLAALVQVVEAVREWRGGAYVVLVSNQEVQGVEPDEQVLRPSPACVAGKPDNLCLPWEAIRVLKEYGSRGGYSQYAYFEGDILCPAATFDFWQLHVEEFHMRGLLLLPHRRAVQEDGSEVLVDCFQVMNTGPWQLCGNAVWYKPPSSLLENSNNDYHDDDKDRPKDCPSDSTEVYFHPSNPYTAGFLMNQAQFEEYLVSPGSEYSPNASAWPVREMAAAGLVWDTKYGAEKVITHADMPVWHSVPLTNKSMSSHPFSEMESLLALCLSTCNCSSLSG